MTCSMKANAPIPDGTYHFDREGNLADYAAKWGYGYIVATEPNATGIAPLLGTITYGAVGDIAHLYDWRLFGVWTDTETDLVYIDPVEHISDIGTAMSKARERGQIAIWSLRDETEIRVPELETVGA